MQFTAALSVGLKSNLSALHMSIATTMKNNLPPKKKGLDFEVEQKS